MIIARIARRNPAVKVHIEEDEEVMAPAFAELVEDDSDDEVSDEGPPTPNWTILPPGPGFQHVNFLKTLGVTKGPSPQPEFQYILPNATAPAAEDVNSLSTTSNETDDEQQAAQHLEETLFGAINAGDRDKLLKLLGSKSASKAVDSDSLDKVLQLLLTTTYPNTDYFYSHDQEILPDALELLGQSLAEIWTEEYKHFKLYYLKFTHFSHYNCTPSAVADKTSVSIHAPQTSAITPTDFYDSYKICQG
ncbi:hypothetical protein HDU98_000198 [Podochytrium sp. JEL0797]|nr:hypothetical protein HDU98_000198 [Podochytrium sp. JEL0797]